MYQLVSRKYKSIKCLSLLTSLPFLIEKKVVGQMAFRNLKKFQSDVYCLSFSKILLKLDIEDIGWLFLIYVAANNLCTSISLFLIYFGQIPYIPCSVHLLKTYVSGSNKLPPAFFMFSAITFYSLIGYFSFPNIRVCGYLIKSHDCRNTSVGIHFSLILIGS